MILCKEKPLSIKYGIHNEVHDTEGRVIALEFESFYVITVYTPNSGDGLKRLDYRMEWEEMLLAHLNRLNQSKPVVYCGDLNVAHNEIDIKNPSSNRRNAGFTDEERNRFSILLENGYADTFRTLYPETVKYSWWSYRAAARQRNIGWRIDYFVVSDRLRENIKDAYILPELMGSDHCPVGLDMTW